MADKHGQKQTDDKPPTVEWRASQKKLFKYLGQKFSTNSAARGLCVRFWDENKQVKTRYRQLVHIIPVFNRYNPAEFP